MKIKLFELLRKLAGKTPESQPARPAPAPVEPRAEASPQPMRNVVSAYVGAPRNGAEPHALNGNGHSSNGVGIPLQRILTSLPMELKSRVIQPDVGAWTVAISLEKILAQLGRGQVKLTFGELRNLAPAVFTSEPDRDATWVTLPLDEVINKLNPALITRRRVQRRVEVPGEITSPFDAHERAQSRPSVARRADLGANGTPPPNPPAIAPGNNRLFTPSAPTPKPPAALPLNPGLILPDTRTHLNGDGGGKPRTNGSLQGSPEPVSFSPVPPAASPVRGAALPPTPPPAVPTPATAVPEIVTPAPSSIEQAVPGAAKRCPAPLVVPLAALAVKWPDAVRDEILQANLAEAQVSLPFESIEQGLKQGRALFPWKTLRMWLRPAPQLNTSAEDATVLELPLAVIAPLFLTRRGEGDGPRAKVTVDKEIPNLFFGFPQPEPQNKPPQDTNFYPREDAVGEVPAGAKTAAASPGTRFISKYATPNEVVSRAAALENVAGALIALPDGLMVADRLPADLNGDTLSAFLPQIFTKVSQCTRELRMGELNNLNFTVGNVPWKIFRVNAIFFAAFGKVGTPLPTAQLAALAVELDHKPKP